MNGNISEENMVAKGGIKEFFRWDNLRDNPRDNLKKI